MNTFTDIHCHIVPGIDDGAADPATAIAMARQAVADGTTTVIDHGPGGLLGGRPTGQ